MIAIPELNICPQIPCDPSICARKAKELTIYVKNHAFEHKTYQLSLKNLPQFIAKVASHTTDSQVI